MPESRSNVTWLCGEFHCMRAATHAIGQPRGADRYFCDQHTEARRELASGRGVSIERLIKRLPSSERSASSVDHLIVEAIRSRVATARASYRVAHAAYEAAEAELSAAEARLLHAIKLGADDARTGPLHDDKGAS